VARFGGQGGPRSRRRAVLFRFASRYQYVIRPLSYTYTTVLSKSFFHKISRTSSTPAFVTAARPALALISVGRDSPYGHPHAEVVKRWRDAGAQLLTTGERGAVTVSTDGEDLKVETFVKP
jgi:beta-lactamase superfamily II metal-dependent hydrolase